MAPNHDRDAEASHLIDVIDSLNARLVAATEQRNRAADDALIARADLARAIEKNRDLQDARSVLEGAVASLEARLASLEEENSALTARVAELAPAAA